MRLAQSELERFAANRPELYACLCQRGRLTPEGLEFSEDDLRACRRLRGLGDAVAVLAKPVARAIDAVAGTDLEHCGGCAKRQAMLNAAVPFGQSR